MPIYIGLDIGGTKLMVAAADESGAMVRRTRESTPLDLNAGLSLLHRMIADVAAGERIAAIGAAIGGPLDAEHGIVSPLHQPEWREVPLKALMQQRWGCPFFVDVDTNVAAVGEYASGAVACRRFLYITLSTGMGGGYLVDGKIYRGMGEAHPEIGHQAINFSCAHPERVRCECGAPDCLEALISGNGIRRIYGKPAEQLDDPEWAEVAYNLGQGLRNLATIYLPDLIVLGGGVAVGGGERLLLAARQVMAERLRLVPIPDLRLSQLGYDTALRGAIALAQQGGA
ncbi:MAG TPA: ROK family protein [Roseiflexaceae bacterium]|nr:ROK family protein [Roseiflexaceae bacterium]